MFLNKIFLKTFFLFAVCIVNTGQAFEPIPDHVKLSIFNIGQGNFILMKKAKNGIIIDAGTWKSPHDLSLTTKSIACDFEDVTINTVVITHIDKDHWDLMEKTKGGIFSDIRSSLHKALFRSGNLPKLVIGGSCLDKATADASIKIFELLSPGKKAKNISEVLDSGRVILTEDHLNEDGISKIKKILDTSLDLNSSISCIGFRPILPPKTIKTKNTNDHSFVFAFSMYQYDPQGVGKLNTMLFTGDATETTLLNLIGDTKSETPPHNKRFTENKEILNKTNISILPHHGSDTHGSDDWLSYIFGHCPEFFCGIYSIDAVRTKFFHPKSIVIGEEIVKSTKVCFSYKDRTFVLHDEFLDLLDNFEIKPIKRKKITLSTDSILGAFSKKILEEAEQLLSCKNGNIVQMDVLDYSDILQCEIITVKDQEKKEELPMLVPQIKNLECLNLPHEQLFFYKNKDEISRIVTTFPIYSTGDTPLGLYQIILDDMGIYIYTQPKLDMPSFPVLYELRNGAVDLGLPCISGRFQPSVPIPPEYKSELAKRMKFYSNHL